MWLLDYPSTLSWTRHGGQRSHHSVSRHSLNFPVFTWPFSPGPTGPKSVLWPLELNFSFDQMSGLLPGYGDTPGCFIHLGKRTASLTSLSTDFQNQFPYLIPAFHGSLCFKLLRLSQEAVQCIVKGINFEPRKLGLEIWLCEPAQIIWPHTSFSSFVNGKNNIIYLKGCEN